MKPNAGVTYFLSLLLAMVSTTAAAQKELRYTSHVEVRPGAPGFGRPGDRANAMDAVNVVAERGIRTEAGQPDHGLQAGSIVIRRSTDTIVLKAENKTGDVDIRRTRSTRDLRAAGRLHGARASGRPALTLQRPG
jgi:hypothetical protein